MRMINLEVCAHASKLEEKYNTLDKIWKNSAYGKTGDEYKKTRPLFDESMVAHKEWREFCFKHGLI